MVNASNSTFGQIAIIWMLAFIVGCILQGKSVRPNRSPVSQCFSAEIRSLYDPTKG
jgi:hypothetical protein